MQLGFLETRLSEDCVRVSVKNIEDIEASIGSESSTIMNNNPVRSAIKSLLLCCFGYCGMLYLYRYLYGWYKSYKDKKLKKQLPENSGSGGGIKIKGLNNLGNTCFFNSMLQCVIHTVPLHYILGRIITGMDYIVESNIGGPIQVKGAARAGQFTMTLQQFLYEVNSRQDRVMSPWNVLNALSRENTRFAHRTQEDSHEALRCLISALRNDEITGIKAAIYDYYGVTADPASHSELDGESKLCMKEYLANASKGAAIMDQLIGTTLISTTVCHQCQTATQIVELCLDLSLPMSSCENDKSHVSCVDDQNKTKKRSKKKSKKRNSIKKEHIMTGTSHTINLPVNAMPDESNLTTKNTGIDNSSDEEPTEFLNGYFDARVVHLYTNDDPSSSEEEQSDNENVPLKGHPNSETSKSNMMVNHSSQLNTRKHDDSAEVSSVEDTEIESDEEQHGENNIAFSDYKLNLHLKDKGLLHQVPLHNKHSALSLEQCLLEFTGLDVLDEDNKFICQTCTNNNQSEITLCRVSKQILIHKLPPILILQIKRFNIGMHKVTKDNRFVYFPHILDMAPYCTTQCFEKLGDLNGKILYGLYAVVVHSGSLQGGHYTAYVRQRPVLTDQSVANQITHPVNAAYDQKRVYDVKVADDGEWYYTSDSHVSRCRFSEVQRCQAYLLFYEMLPLVYI